MKIYNLENQRFGRLRVIGEDGRDKGHVLWLCECDCGQLAHASSNALVKGSKRSCGCLRRELNNTNPLRQHPAYSRWLSMMARCYQPSTVNFKDYGGRGITVCDRWRESPAKFIQDMGIPPEGLSLERLDNNKGYSPDNCIWASRQQQNRNKRTTQLTLELACYILFRSQAGESLRKIADAYGVTYTAALEVVRRRTWLEAYPKQPQK